MNLSQENKLEISYKLEKELCNLSLLEDRIAKSSQIAKGVDHILNTFEERLSRLEDTILPVYNETENLQKSQHNIDRTLQLLDSVISYYEVSSRVDDVIEKGPGVVTESGVDLEIYLQCMNKLARAQKYFEKHIPQSVELENVSTLFNKGSDKLNFEFKATLDKHSMPLLLGVLMMMINTDDDTSNEYLIQPTPNFPDKFHNDLVHMAEWLLDNGKDDFLTVYGISRGAILQKSMTMLKNHQKSVSGGSTHGGSPMFRNKFQNRHDTSARRPSTRRMQNVFEKKANKIFQRASATLEQSTGLTLTGRRMSTHLEASSANEEIDNEQEMENYLVSVVALHKLMQIELAMMKDIIAINHQPSVFELIVRDAMDSIVQDGENIASRAKRCINRHDFAAVLVIFPILKQLLILKPDFEKTVEECDPNVKAKFEYILTTLHTTGLKALEDFIESLRSDSISQLPKDGTVHELTSNVLMFLEQLLDYTDTISRVLQQDPTYKSQVDKLKSSDKNKAYIGLYIKKALVQLNHTLLSKSEQYGDSALKATFRLNNNNYVLKSLQRSKLLELYLISEPKCEEYYHNSIQEHKKAYLQSWNKLLNYISIDDAPLYQHGKLKDKERAVVKEKFAGFNKEMEEIAKVQRGYSIPDVQLRESLKRDNKEYIIPKYNSFFNVFSIIQFTKNPEKYIKYKPDEVVTIIDNFFDVAA